MRAIYLLAFVAVVAILPAAESGVYSHGSKQTEDRNAKYYKTSEKVAGPTASRNKSQPPPGRKGIISAWGIIALVLGVIILSTIAYYAFLLYPYICKKDASYDIIELTEVNSVCTVSDAVNNVPHLRVYCDSNNVSNDVSNNASLNQ
ncbi:PREDICTED: uncharacterized protein LOC105569626 [Vollenhovia emeryi]|uniref:uncharacterized protein LOC105569626 n=1 Tax=Vollenhovia emeryi TaxID=411798 RepID=UPI0005F360C9|nr:PREDICTED: uncharacterized protein LOC105569626 [Vollenhovia emeryi]XP_011881634.1 PREDICTED: uncharacterized protein LOC105569626 [Vollenhovia emeryi]